MTSPTPPAPTLRDRNRRAARDLVLDAAERLLASGADADFSMRALAAEAGVGFATPFNHFGSKTAIMQALSGRLIARMAERYAQARPSGDAAARVRAMARIATGLLLEQPAIAKTVIGSLSVPGVAPTGILPLSEALWSQTLDEPDPTLARHLAFAFRGCLSFWIAGDLPDDALTEAAETTTSLLLTGRQVQEARPPGGVWGSAPTCPTLPE